MSTEVRGLRGSLAADDGLMRWSSFFAYSYDTPKCCYFALIFVWTYHMNIFRDYSEYG